MHWYKAINHYAASGKPYVIATVVATTGSAPRPAGTKMVIGSDREHDTLGGGQLEHLVIARARELMGAEQTMLHIEHFPLAAAALQCCGGSVTVLLECYGAAPLRVAVFGAGHIGQRVVCLLENLDADIRWIDDASRQPEGDLAAQELATTLDRCEEPCEQIHALPENTHVLIVTHDHQLDYALLAAALNRGASQYASLGVIGSATKSQRFRKRLQADGFAADDVASIRCPLGAGGATDKQPWAIAIAIIAELLNVAGEQASAVEPVAELSWQQIKSTLVQQP